MSTVSETTHDGAVAVSAPPAFPTTASAPAQLAAKYGLSVSGARPGLPEYVRQLWGRRHFISAFARAKLTAQYSQAKLGQVWQVATPLLNAAVYYLIFGLLIGTEDRASTDFIAFLVTGVFIFTFTQTSVIGRHAGDLRQPGPGAGAALPARLLPISFSPHAAPAAAVLDVRAGGRSCWLRADARPGPGCWSSRRWRCQFVFNTGLAMVMARLGSKTTDLAQLMPFIMRTWMYASGVMFSIDLILKGKHVPALRARSLLTPTRPPSTST